MKIGLLLPTRESVLFGGSDAARLLDFAVQAESLGFDSLWMGDSLFARPRFEPLALMAAVAARTTRVTVGTAVLLSALRPPLLLAHSVATADRLSGGRVVLGVGAGASIPATQAEFDAVGVSFDRRVRVLHDGVAACRATWRGDGENVLPRPVQQGGPPVWLGGEGPRTLARCGRDYDGWLPYSPDPAAWARGWIAVQEAAAAAGRVDAVTPAAYLTVTVDDDAGRAEAEQRAHMEAYYDAPFDLMRMVQGCRAGTFADVLEWLNSYVEAGARHLVLRLGTTDAATQVAAASELAAALRAG